MKGGLCLIFILALSFSSFVFADNNSSGEDVAVAGEWDDFSDGNDMIIAEEVNESDLGDSNYTYTPGDEYSGPANVVDVFSDNRYYTENFYQALWISVGALLLLILLLYLILRRPKNRWKSNTLKS